MADGIFIESNALEIMRRFRALPKKVKAKVIPPALRAAGKPIIQLARAIVPRKSTKRAIAAGEPENTGALRAALGSKLLPKRKRSTRTLLIGVRRGAQFIRFDSDSRPHIPWLYALEVEKEQSYLRVAVDVRATAAITAFAIRLNIGMTREIAKLGAKRG